MMAWEVPEYTQLGWVINKEKSDLVVGRKKEFIGYVVDTIGCVKDSWHHL